MTKHLRLLTIALAATSLFAQKIDYEKQVKNKPVLDVREFGAKPDDGNDDTAAINSALAAAAALGSGEIVFPRGQFEVTSTITIGSSRIRLSGSGRGVTTIATSGLTTQDVFSFSSGTFNGLSGLSIACEASQTSGYAVSAADQVMFTAENLYITNCPSGFRLTDTNMAKVSNVRITELEDSSGIGVHISGAGTFAALIDRVITDNGSGVPFAGIRIKQSGDVTISGSHFIHSGYGMVIDPDAGQIVNSVDVIGASTYFDNSQIQAVRIAPVAGAVERVRFIGSWFASSLGAGVHIVSGSGQINGVSFEGCQFYLNAHHGLIAEGTGASNVRVHNSVFAGNGQAAPGTYNGAFFNMSNWSFVGNRSGQSDSVSWPATQASGLAVYADANTNYTITGNDFSGNLTTAMTDAGTGTAKVIRDNLGVDDEVATKESAATLVLPVNPVVKITGTTTVGAVSGQWIGREVTLITVDGAVTFNASSSIGNTFTSTQNVPIKAVSDGTKLYLK